MNTVFVFGKGPADAYASELEAAWEKARGAGLACSRVGIDELSLDLLLASNADVLVSGPIKPDWYYLLKGLKIVSVTFGPRRELGELADILIDHLSEDSSRYFTGPEYSVRSESDFDVIEVFQLAKKLEWDSQFFGMNVGYLSCRSLTESIAYRVDRFVKAERIRVLEYLCNCHDRRSVLAAEKEGFHFADIRLSFAKRVEPAAEPAALPEGIRFGVAKPRHIPALRAESAGIYADSRYFFDSNFPEDRVKEFYPLWIEKAVHGRYDHECLGLFDQASDRPIGFCSVRHSTPLSTAIGLFGVSPAFRGAGLAVKLLQLVETRLRERGTRQITVVTQGRNYNAQRVYQAAGFRTRATELWYHKWL